MPPDQPGDNSTSHHLRSLKENGKYAAESRVVHFVGSQNVFSMTFLSPRRNPFATLKIGIFPKSISVISVDAGDTIVTILFRGW